MKKTVVFVLSLMSALALTMSCDQQKSLQEYIREEEKAISRYIDLQGIQVTGKLPTYAEFQQNEKLYYKSYNGLYIHVVDSGNGQKVKPLVSEVQVRFESYLYIKTYIQGDTVATTLPGAYFPMQFLYGNSASYLNLACNGWAIPLDVNEFPYLGEKAVVDLIVPSDLGNSSDNQAFLPVFYKNLKYTAFY